MYLTPTVKHWACDIEADDLLAKATKIWCATVLNLVTKEERFFLDADEFKAFLDEHGDAIFVGHNFLAYDAPMLNRFWGAGIAASRIVDTFVLSMLYNPNFQGGHSLEIWGQRVRYPKGKFDEFDRYSETMLKYCRRDTRLTGLVFHRLSERMRSVGFTELGAELEHKAWHIIQNKQKKNGFPFNKPKAEELYAELRQREEELKDEIYKLWPPQLLCVGEYSRPFKKDGDRSANYERHLQQYPKVELVGDGYRVFDYVEFNLGSPPQRIAKLLELGWEPVNKTKKGNPKVDEDELLSFAESSRKPEVGALAKWIVVNSRANMVRTWLEAYNEETGCIHGNLFLAGTLRYKHSSPNSANIPAVRLKKDENDNEHILYGEDGAWTYECRDLWWAGADDDFVLVGIDGTGIQNRCLVHNLIRIAGEEAVAPFKELALSGDVHKRNIEVLGLANKAAAKKFYYTLMMGGGGGRLAADQAQFGTRMSAKEGEEKRKMMIDGIPGFQSLINSLQAELDKTGRITLCDGTPIVVSSPHMVIPYLLQGDESRLMKQAMIFVDEEVRRNGWTQDVFKVADIHDEWQYKVRRSVAEAFIVSAKACFPRAGQVFGYNIQIDGDAKIGRTWAATH